MDGEPDKARVFGIERGTKETFDLPENDRTWISFLAKGDALESPRLACFFDKSINLPSRAIQHPAGTSRLRHQLKAMKMSEPIKPMTELVLAPCHFIGSGAYSEECSRDLPGD
jgi:hypothetical protein